MIFITDDKIDFYLIQDDKGVYQLVDILDNHPGSLGLDIETYPDTEQWGCEASALDPNTAKARLISLNSKGNPNPWVIDLLNISNSELLINYLYERHFRDYLIAHNASFDHNIIRSNWGYRFSLIRDTKTAMATNDVTTGWKAGNFRGRTLNALGRDYFYVVRDKELGKSDWSRSNLSKEQLVYSALDVGAPKGHINKYTGEPLHSILIEGFELLREISDSLGQVEAFDLDQDMVSAVSDMEYYGIPLSQSILTNIGKECNRITNKSIRDICKELKVSVKKEPYRNDEGKIKFKTVIPKEVVKLINSNTRLVKELNKFLKARLGVELDNLQTSTLNSLLDSLKDNEEEELIDSDNTWNRKVGIGLVDALLDYKRHEKVLGDCNKYLASINPKTGRMHSSIIPVGTSTSRMASRGGDSGMKINLQAVSTKDVVFDIDRDEINKYRHDNTENS
jgi:hypothetical protein